MRSTRLLKLSNAAIKKATDKVERKYTIPNIGVLLQVTFMTKHYQRESMVCVMILAAESQVISGQELTVCKSASPSLIN